MAEKDKDKKQGGLELTRRDFVKAAGAAGAVAATGLEWAASVGPAAAALENGMVKDTDYKVFISTCPYCSACCGQKVAVALRNWPVGSLDADAMYKKDDVIDVYGNDGSPINRGGLCAKGAGSYQLVTNKRRLGVPWNTTGMQGTAWWRLGNGDWNEIALQDAINEIAAGSKDQGRDHLGMVGYRNEKAPTAANYYNSNRVYFMGCSHANNEVNYTYRKLIAAFGTSQVEHQARI